MPINSQIRQIIQDVLDKYSISCTKILLFGSRAKNTNIKTSDFDILIETQNQIPHDKKLYISKLIRQKLALLYIKLNINAGTDILIKSSSDTEYLKSKPGSVVKNALAESINI